jgi:hypothetical protein
MGNYSFECKECGYNHKSYIAYISKFYLCYDGTLDSTICNTKDRCECNIEYLLKDVYYEINSEQIEEENDIFFKEIIKLDYILDIENDLIECPLENEKRVKKCKLTIKLKEINDINNIQFHYSVWDFSGHFNNEISDNYNVEYNLHVKSILCEDCYMKLSLE